ncbi:MAG: tRNA (guanosine(46)-N7)-methyltransferase TrmB [Spirochaetales bacterium]|nr:tRNA (guanosine(46)-N7)-methyltransferase TrmB [Spirochaetales bacterium]
MENRRTIKSYVLRSGRFTQKQKEAYDNYSQDFCIDYQENLLSFKETFQNENEVILDIGFGMGDSVREISQAMPDKNFIGIEVHKPGVGALAFDLKDLNIKNAKIISYDAVEVVKNMIPDSSVGGFHIFFPDPWQKKKHNKRRLLNEEFIEILAGKLKVGGYIYVATDWADYAEQVLDLLSANKKLKNSTAGFAQRAPWRPITKFEKKGLTKNHNIYDIWFTKV